MYMDRPDTAKVLFRRLEGRRKNNKIGIIKTIFIYGSKGGQEAR